MPGTRYLLKSRMYKGWFATPAALNTAYPTGKNGWHANVGTTDTIWVWDSDTVAWVDSGASGTTLFAGDGITIDVSDFIIVKVDGNTTDFDASKNVIRKHARATASATLLFSNEAVKTASINIGANFAHVQQLRVYLATDPTSPVGTARISVYRTSANDGRLSPTRFRKALHWTTLNGALSGAESTFAVVDASNFEEDDMLRLLGGAAEDSRFVSESSDVVTPQEDVDNAHSDATGVVNVVECEGFVYFDEDAGNEMHVEVQFPDGNVTCNVVVEPVYTK